MFLSKEHAARFWEVWQRLERRSEQEDGCLLYVLTAFLDVWREAQAVGVDQGQVLDWRPVVQMISGASHGRRVLLNWALGLAAVAEDEMDPVVLMILDEEHFCVAVEALLIRRYGLRVLMPREGGVR
ncbi:hypothetical protein [Thermogemmatispora aurantia]|nr:hypothetical protein [Thermogemmatispora aurantia]